MADTLSTSSIYDALSMLDREAGFRRNCGGNSNYERARDIERTAKDAMAEFHRLSDAMPRLRALKREADREYDQYVTRGPEGCSCHINPPCGYCTSQSEDDEGEPA